jgi:hypothetical protein
MAINAKVSVQVNQTTASARIVDGALEIVMLTPGNTATIMLHRDEGLALKSILDIMNDMPVA